MCVKSWHKSVVKQNSTKRNGKTYKIRREEVFSHSIKNNTRQRQKKKNIRDGETKVGIGYHVNIREENKINRDMILSKQISWC